MARSKKSTAQHYNKVLKMADYTDTINTRKKWEVDMALRTLRDHGATSPDALILGVGAGHERTIFKLANPQDCKFVFATDLYLDIGVWTDFGDISFLDDPGKFKKEEDCNPNQIIPRHADMRALPFPDNTFDGIFSSGSIEHVGVDGAPNWEAIAQAAKEIGRVLKPGGVASISTEWKLAGEGWGWLTVSLFDEKLLYKHVIKPSGLDLIDDLDTTFDGDLEHVIDLYDIVAHGKNFDGYGVLQDHGFLFTSVHLALRKPE